MNTNEQVIPILKELAIDLKRYYNYPVGFVPYFIFPIWFAYNGIFENESSVLMSQKIDFFLAILMIVAATGLYMVKANLALNRQILALENLVIQVGNNKLEGEKTGSL